MRYEKITDTKWEKKVLSRDINGGLSIVIEENDDGTFDVGRVEKSLWQTINGAKNLKDAKRIGDNYLDSIGFKSR